MGKFKKSDARKQKSRTMQFFGIENGNWFDEIDNDTMEEISSKAMYRKTDGTSERWHFSATSDNHGDVPVHFVNEKTATLDEMCELKNIELNTLLKEILSFSEEVKVCNSYAKICRSNIVIKAFGGILDSLKTAMLQSAEKKMPYVYTVYAAIDALNVALGNISKEDVVNFAESKKSTNIFGYSELCVGLSYEIEKHIREIDEKCKKEQTKTSNFGSSLNSV